MPDLPPRHIAGRGGDRLSLNSNFEVCPVSGEPLSGKSISQFVLNTKKGL